MTGQSYYSRYHGTPAKRGVVPHVQKHREAERAKQVQHPPMIPKKGK